MHHKCLKLILYIVSIHCVLTPLPLVLHICVREWGQHWFRYWLIAYSAPSHYLNQCLVIVIWTLRNKPQWNFNQNLHFFIHKNVFENVVCEMAAILSRGRWDESFIDTEMMKDGEIDHQGRQGNVKLTLVNIVAADALAVKLTLVNIMAADALAHGASASAAVLLTYFSKVFLSQHWNRVEPPILLRFEKKMAVVLQTIFPNTPSVIKSL